MKIKKDTTVKWLYKDADVIVPDGAIGFVYFIEFTDGSKYIGKKNLYSTKTMKALKSGKIRPNTICRRYKNTGKGNRQAYDIVRTDSDWRTYQGSAEACTDKVPEKKYILEFAYSQLELTYLEAKYLFTYEVLEDSNFINGNILGSFFKGSLNEYVERKKASFSLKDNQA